MTVQLRAATRASELARWQTDRVGALLATHGVEVVPVPVSTHGDRRLDLPLSEIGGKGVFVTEVQSAVLDGRADIAVHSAKDLPAVTPDGLTLAVFPERGDPGDILVGATLENLAVGAVVATGAARRQSQLAHYRPDLTFVGLRGNIATRLTQAAAQPVIVAAAAIERLGIELSGPFEVLDREALMIPQVGQGTIAVECRSDDAEVVSTLERLAIPDLERCTAAERGFLTELGAGCDLPVAAHATVAGAEIQLNAMIAALDGSWKVQRSDCGSEPENLGRSVARALLLELTPEQRGGLAP